MRYEGDTPIYYHANSLGSVVALTDEDGELLETVEYDVYGSPSITQHGSNPPTGNRYLFTGREYDFETGLYHYRARAYSPSLGRFLQRDPIPAVNLYTYVKNQPVIYRDPSGLLLKTADMPGSCKEYNVKWAGGDSWYGDDDSYLWYTGFYWVQDFSSSKTFTFKEGDVSLGLWVGAQVLYDNFWSNTPYTIRLHGGSVYNITHKIEGNKKCCTAKYVDSVVYEHDVSGVQIQSNANLRSVETVVEKDKECQWQAIFNTTFSSESAVSSGWTLGAELNGKGVGASASMSQSVTISSVNSFGVPTVTIDFSYSGKLEK